VREQPTEIRHYVRENRTDIWSWRQRWGPQIGDEREWSLSRTGDSVTIQQARTELQMDVQVAGRLLIALSLALKPDDFTPEAAS
jgi:hypothetical protein